MSSQAKNTGYDWKERLRRKRMIKRKFAESKGLCAYCDCIMTFPAKGEKQPPNAATMDHIIPRARWTGDILERTLDHNIAIVCKACNDAKADMTMNELLRACLIVGAILDSGGQPAQPEGGVITPAARAGRAVIARIPPSPGVPGDRVGGVA